MTPFGTGRPRRQAHARPRHRRAPHVPIRSRSRRRSCSEARDINSPPGPCLALPRGVGTFIGAADRSRRRGRAYGGSGAPEGRRPSARTAGSRASVWHGHFGHEPRGRSRSRRPRPRRAPGEGSMRGDEDGRHLGRVEPESLEGLDDHRAGLRLVVARDLRSRVSWRVTGTGPWKWSAWVVPKAGIARPAWAQAVAAVECVWTTPPISGKRRYRREVGRRVGRRSQIRPRRHSRRRARRPPGARVAAPRTARRSA